MKCYSPGEVRRPVSPDRAICRAMEKDLGFDCSDLFDTPACELMAFEEEDGHALLIRHGEHVRRFEVLDDDNKRDTKALRLLKHDVGFRLSHRGCPAFGPQRRGQGNLPSPAVQAPVRRQQGAQAVEAFHPRSHPAGPGLPRRRKPRHVGAAAVARTPHPAARHLAHDHPALRRRLRRNRGTRHRLPPPLRPAARPVLAAHRERAEVTRRPHLRRRTT